MVWPCFGVHMHRSFSFEIQKRGFMGKVKRLSRTLGCTEKCSRFGVRQVLQNRIRQDLLNLYLPQFVCKMGLIPCLET